MEYDECNLDELRDYTKYYNLADTDIRFLFVACAALDPDFLIGKVMLKDEDGYLCGTSIYRIYDGSQVRYTLVVVNSIFIVGRNRSVKKVIAYRLECLKTYYIQPMLALTAILEQERRLDAINNLLDTCSIS